MALPREYETQDCPIARTLEIVGERWTLLIIRDAFYGVRRFSDFRDHLSIPRAVLTERLNLLQEHGLFATERSAAGRDEYLLTEKGLALWPTIWSLLVWGNEYRQQPGTGRYFVHAECGGAILPSGVCDSCGQMPPPQQLITSPPVGRRQADDVVSIAMRVPHRLLEPIAH